MTIEHAITALVLISGLSLLAQVISRGTHLPLSSVLVLLGFAAAELIIRAGFDTGLRADNFQSLVFFVFIPVLVFESAYNIDKKALRENIIIILSLAIIALMLCCVIAAVLLYYGIGHAAGFPWLAALIAGALLAATDPVAVVDKLKEMRAPRRLCILLEGESLFNDAAAIVIFSLFLSMAVASANMDNAGEVYSITAVIAEFTTIFFGGAAIGLIFGGVLGLMQRTIQQLLLRGVMSLIVAYGSFLLAEHFMVSGVMSTLLAALAYSLAGRSVEGEHGSTDKENTYLWNMLAFFANVSVFLIVGAVITLQMFEQRWLAMLIAIAAILIARAVSVYGVLALFSCFKTQKVSLSEQTVMVWGGLRGAVTLALALSLPTSLDYWWTIQSIAFGVVLFSLFVQAPTMGLLSKHLLHGRDQ